MFKFYPISTCIVLKLSLDFIKKMLSDTLTIALIVKNLLINTDYRCWKNVADKPISNVLPINQCITIEKYCDEIQGRWHFILYKNED